LNRQGAKDAKQRGRHEDRKATKQREGFGCAERACARRACVRRALPGSVTHVPGLHRGAPRAKPLNLQLGVLGALGGSPSRTRSRAHGAKQTEPRARSPHGATDAVSATCYADVQ